MMRQTRLIIKNICVLGMWGNRRYLLLDDSPMEDETKAAWYGIEWDDSSAGNAVKRIGNPDLQERLPIQNAMRRCYMWSDGSMAKGADDYNIDEGYAQVMIEIPTFYVKFEQKGAVKRCKMSAEPLDGFTRWGKCYVSAYEASVDNNFTRNNNYRVGALCSVASKIDDRYNKFPDYPNEVFAVTNKSVDDFKRLARNRGKGWRMYTYDVHKRLYWLYAVEMAMFATPFTEESLWSLGKSSRVFVTDWAQNFNKMPCFPCGWCGDNGEATGTPLYIMRSGSDLIDDCRYFYYRGVEHPFGHIWKMIEDLRVIYVGDMLTYSLDGEEVDNYEPTWNAYATSYAIDTIYLGEKGDIFPMTGKTANSFYGDKLRINLNVGDVSPVLLGGDIESEDDAGWGCFGCYGVTNAPNVGTRLVYYPDAKD